MTSKNSPSSPEPSDEKAPLRIIYMINGIPVYEDKSPPPIFIDQEKLEQEAKEARRAEVTFEVERGCESICSLTKRLIEGVRLLWKSPKHNFPGNFNFERENPSLEELEEVKSSILKDYERGVVQIEINSEGKHPDSSQCGDQGFYHHGEVDIYKNSLKQCPGALIEEESILEKLTANDNSLLKRVAKMPGGGELIGHLPDGRLVFKSRGNIPIIFAKDKEGNWVMILPDDPDREKHLRFIEKYGVFANCKETLECAEKAGWIVPTVDPHDSYKRGLVAATEAITGKPFVEGKDFTQAVLIPSKKLDEDMPGRVVTYCPKLKKTGIGSISNEKRSPRLGVIPFLIE